MIFARVFIPFAIGYLLSYLLRVINSVIAPSLINDLGLSASDLGLLTSANLFAFAAFQLPLGVLLDRYGPRKAESALLLIAAMGCAIFALSGSLALLMLGRAMMGLGTSACLMAAFTAYALFLPKEKLPSINAYQMMAGGGWCTFGDNSGRVAGQRNRLAWCVFNSWRLRGLYVRRHLSGGAAPK